MSGPASYVTSKLVDFTDYSLSPIVDDGFTLKYLAKKAAVVIVNGLHTITQIFEKVIGFLYSKAQEVIASEKFQTAKNFTVAKLTIVKDYVVDVTTRFYQTISELQRPPLAAV